MRTTLEIESDVLDLARSLAQARRISVGKALSWLARKGAQSTTTLSERNGFCIFPVADPHVKFGPDDVQVALDEDDRIVGRDFLEPVAPGRS